MKILRLTLVAAIALGATAFSACSRENEVTKDQEMLKSDGSIVFSLNLPAGDPLVFTRGIYNQDDSEAALKTLRMFEFYADTEVLVASKDIDVYTDLTSPGGSYEWTYTPGTAYNLSLSLNSLASLTLKPLLLMVLKLELKTLVTNISLSKKLMLLSISLILK